MFNKYKELVTESAVANNGGAMEADTISKNGRSSKSQTSRINSFVFIVFFVLFCSYCFGQVSIQQNQQNVNINVPVIEKTVYVDRYRTVYVDRPQPKRVAKKLSAPVLLLGYLWVYPEDIGNFKQHPLDVIKNINAQNPHGRNNWRIPTHDELMVMEANADKVGLGDDMYMATSHSNGLLRLVSTGQSVAEQKAEQKKQDEQSATERRIAEQRASEQRATEQRLAEQRAAEQRAREEAANETKRREDAEIDRLKKETKVRFNVSLNDKDKIEYGWRLATDRELTQIGDKYVKILTNNSTADILTSESRIVDTKIDIQTRRYLAGNNAGQLSREMRGVNQKYKTSTYYLNVSVISTFKGKKNIESKFYDSRKQAESNKQNDFNQQKQKGIFTCIYVKK